MKTLKVKPPPTSEGWSIHVYDGDRHLCCTIEPSHGWALGIGIGTGILMSVLFSNLAVTADSQNPAGAPPRQTAPSTAESMPAQSTPVNLTPPWID